MYAAITITAALIALVLTTWSIVSDANKNVAGRNKEYY